MMKLRTVPVKDVVANPWRDEVLFPIDEDQVKRLVVSIDDHDFLGGVKGRYVNGKVQIGCGHARIAAVRRAGRKEVSIYIEDMDDDQMLRLMTDENALQSGGNPAAIMNEVASITKRLVQVMLPADHFSAITEKWLFENVKGFDTARGKLLARLHDPEKDGGIGEPLISRYLTKAKTKPANRTGQQIRDAISALKQSGIYDKIVDEALQKTPLPSIAPTRRTKAVILTKPRKPKVQSLDPRCAQVFENDHQFQAFRSAITTEAAKKAIPVDDQFALAKEIVRKDPKDFSKKQVGAPFIKAVVHGRVEQYMREQRKLDKEERDRYLQEQLEQRVKSEVKNCMDSTRSLISGLGRVCALLDQYPALIVDHRIGGLSARLDQVGAGIAMLNKKLKGRK